MEEAPVLPAQQDLLGKLGRRGRRGKLVNVRQDWAITLLGAPEETQALLEMQALEAAEVQEALAGPVERQVGQERGEQGELEVAPVGKGGQCVQAQIIYFRGQ